MIVPSTPTLLPAPPYSTMSLPHFAMNQLCDSHLYRKTHRSVRGEVLREVDSLTEQARVGVDTALPGGVPVINQHGSGCTSSHTHVLFQDTFL